MKDVLNERKILAVCERLQDSYKELMISREDAIEAIEVEAVGEEMLKDAEAELRVEGKVEGKNEAEREAHLRALTVKTRVTKTIAASKSRRAKAAIEIAKDKVRMYESMKDILIAIMEA